jgi:hypothetical protein
VAAPVVVVIVIGAGRRFWLDGLTALPVGAALVVVVVVTVAAAPLLGGDAVARRAVPAAVAVAGRRLGGAEQD